MKSFRLFLFILGVSLIVFCTPLFSQTMPSVKQKPVPTEALFEKGEKLYQKQCASCHGLTGAGDGEAAYLLYPKPRDFTRGEFRLVSTTTMEATDEDLFKTINRGMVGSAMPPWEFLPEEDRWSLVYYIRYLSELGRQEKTGAMTEGMDWETRKRLMTKEITSDSLIHVGQEPSATKENFTRGRELFVKACAPCHGLQGKGDGQQKMQDSSGYPLKPRDLTSGLFKGSSSSEDLYHRMIAGIPGTPMPSYQGAFSEEQIWDLIHYAQSLSNPEAEKRARLQRHSLIAKKIKGPLSVEPLSNQWKPVKPVFVALTPLWWRNERVPGIEVKTVHNGEQIAFHLSWPDAAKDSNTVPPQSFSDGVALEFSMEKDPPFFGMGNRQSAVSFWHWKASWEKERKDIETQYPNRAVDETVFHDPQLMTGWAAGNPLSDPRENSAAEEGMAKGLGSFTTQRPSLEKVEAKGIWHDGKWEVVFQGALQLKPGETVSVAFAVWDGAKGDRNGQKMVSIWNELKLE